MARYTWALLMGVLLALPGPATAAADAAAGTWEVYFPLQEGVHPVWLLQLQNKDGKWSGELVGKVEGIPETTLGDVSVSGGLVRFTLNVTGPGKLTFEGKLPADGGKKINGSWSA